MIIRYFQEQNIGMDVTQTLYKYAIKNNYIRNYLDNIKRTQTWREEHKSKSIKYLDIVDEVLYSKPYISFTRKRGLTEDEIDQIANRLRNETNKSNIERLLYIFDFYKFPYDSKIILDFAKQKPTNKNRIVEFATCALKHLQSNEIRCFAINKIRNSKQIIDYLKILISNYRSGDFILLSEIVNKTNNEHKIELLAGIYSEIYTLNKSKECKEPLEILYNKMNCGICRKKIIEILIDNEVLSDKIRHEIKFDSNLETRKLANLQ